MRYSTTWKNWKTMPDLKTCLICLQYNGKIYDINDIVLPAPPIHLNCRCKIERLKTILAGTATTQATNGADWHLKIYGKLPNYYISKMQAEKLGYVNYLGNLSTVAPGKMIFKGIYGNKNGHLPDAPNRVWYEADINYVSGYRGTERILFSNDGLIFVTYDHYGTFIEIE